MRKAWQRVLRRVVVPQPVSPHIYYMRLMKLQIAKAFGVPPLFLGDKDAPRRYRDA